MNMEGATRKKQNREETTEYAHTNGRGTCVNQDECQMPPIYPSIHQHVLPQGSLTRNRIVPEQVYSMYQSPNLSKTKRSEMGNHPQDMRKRQQEANIHVQSYSTNQSRVQCSNDTKLLPKGTQDHRQCAVAMTAGSHLVNGSQSSNHPKHTIKISSTRHAIHRHKRSRQDGATESTNADTKQSVLYKPA